MVASAQMSPATKTSASTSNTSSTISTNPKGTPFVYKKGTPVPAALVAQAKEVAESRRKTTNAVPKGEGHADLPILKLKDLKLGKLLGNGSYSSAHVIVDKKTKGRILKQLNPKVKANPLVFAACAADLVQEGQILHYIAKSQQHILDIYAWSGPNIISDYLNGNPDNCFLVLEQLVDTLDDKLKSWQEQSNSVWYLVYEETNQPEYLKTLRKKCGHILGLAQALQHLHQHRVLHRDLKPGEYDMVIITYLITVDRIIAPDNVVPLFLIVAANIGFNREGVLKVFDFDLARILPKEASDDELFLMTHNVGSTRYMAPEIKAKQKYNCSADVYSFGILVYQMLTLEVPISTTVRDWSTHNKYIPEHWSAELRQVMGSCLHDADHLKERPSMAKLVTELNDCPMPRSETNKNGSTIGPQPQRKGWLW